MFTMGFMGGFFKAISGFFGIFGTVLGGLFSAMGAILGVIFSIIILIIRIVARMRILQKMGENPIIAIIPFYNDWVLYRNVLGEGWYSILLFVPVVKYIINILYSFELAIVFGKSFINGIINLVVPPLGEVLIGFTDCDYYGLRSDNLMARLVNWFKGLFD